jgi:hypothetical protein
MKGAVPNYRRFENKTKENTINQIIMWATSLVIKAR